ncbi:hypothetical protein C802_01504 [Phocaeicola sartorii]|uniref:Uncharacterized protein n=1 Tax=Phocaeicola sartorii TaxID=671267 RepID=R9II06_9BACT|nr:hypothetical protein C802_01504 [Phocaeicola sartorii]
MEPPYRICILLTCGGYEGYIYNIYNTKNYSTYL